MCYHLYLVLDIQKGDRARRIANHESKWASRRAHEQRIMTAYAVRIFSNLYIIHLSVCVYVCALSVFCNVGIYVFVYF